MGKNKVDAKVHTCNVITAKRTYRYFCAILVVIATLYGCLTIRMKGGFHVGDMALLPPSSVETEQNKATAVQKHQSDIVSFTGGQDSRSLYANSNSVRSEDSSNIDAYRKYSNAASRTTNGNETRTPNTFVKIDKALTLEDMEGHTWRKESVLTYKKIVLIVAYMSTGSTLTGSLFQAYPGTFYVFEPIRLLADDFSGLGHSNKTYVTFRYVNGTKRNYSASEKNKVILDELASWLNCKIESIRIRSLKDSHHREYTKVMRTFYDCFKGRLGTNITNAGENPKLYFKQAMKSCEKAPLRVIKVIRLSMKEAKKLLPFYPNMKIIHLVRDPRGILNSRLKIHEVEMNSFNESAENHCCTLEKDLKFSKEIMQSYTNRLKIVHYEDLAERPIETAQACLTF